MNFKSELKNNVASTIWGGYINVPAKIAESMIDGKNRRVKIHVNGHPFQCAIMPNKGEYFINIGAPIRSTARLTLGQTYVFEIEKDNSKYGFDLPPEFEEIMLVDTLFSEQFHHLTPGVQRSLIYLVLKLKSNEKRIQKTLAIAEHMAENKGQIDYKGLNLKFKEYTQRFN